MIIARLVKNSVCLCVLSLLPLPSHAEGTDAKEQFDEGVEALKKEDFLKAVEAFEASYAAAPKATVLYNIGMCRKAMFQYKAAKTALKRFLAENPELADSKRASDVRTALAEIDTRLGHLDIRVSESGAEIRVDGKAIGRSPLSEPFTVDPGTHAIEVILAGYESFCTESDVRSGETVPVEAALTALPEPKAPELPAKNETRKKSPAGADGGCSEPPLTPVENESMSKRDQALLISGVSALSLAAAGIAAGAIYTAKWSREYDTTAELVSLCRATPEETCTNAHVYYSGELDKDRVGIAVGFAVGGALIAAGTALLTTRYVRRRKRDITLGFSPSGFTVSF